MFYKIEEMFGQLIAGKEVHWSEGKGYTILEGMGDTRGTGDKAEGSSKFSSELQNRVELLFVCLFWGDCSTGGFFLSTDQAQKHCTKAKHYYTKYNGKCTICFLTRYKKACDSKLIWLKFWLKFYLIQILIKIWFKSKFCEV